MSCERLRSEYKDHLDGLRTPENEETTGQQELARQMRPDVLDIKRREITRLRDSREIDDTALREVLSGLEIEEVRLLGPRSEECRDDTAPF